MLSACVGADVLHNDPLCLFSWGVATTESSAMVFFLYTQQSRVVLSRGPDPQLQAFHYFCSASTSHTAWEKKCLCSSLHPCILVHYASSCPYKAGLKGGRVTEAWTPFLLILPAFLGGTWAEGLKERGGPAV